MLLFPISAVAWRQSPGFHWREKLSFGPSQLVGRVLILGFIADVIVL
jgi:hypothetical protein